MNHLNKQQCNKFSIIYYGFELKKSFTIILLTFYVIRYSDLKNERTMTSILVILCRIEIALYVIYLLELIVDVLDKTIIE